MGTANERRRRLPLAESILSMVIDTTEAVAKRQHVNMMVLHQTNDIMLNKHLTADLSEHSALGHQPSW